MMLKISLIASMIGNSFQKIVVDAGLAFLHPFVIVPGELSVQQIPHTIKGQANLLVDRVEAGEVAF